MSLFLTIGFLLYITFDRCKSNNAKYIFCFRSLIPVSLYNLGISTKGWCIQLMNILTIERIRLRYSHRQKRVKNKFLENWQWKIQQKQIKFHVFSG